MTWLLENSDTVSTLVGLAGSGLQGYSTMASARVDAANLRERAAADRYDAAVAEDMARSEMEGAQADASDFRREQSARVAASRAVAAGSGFTMEGSPMMIDEAGLAEIEFGVQRIVHAGEVRAHRLRQKGELLERRAGVEDRNAGYALQAGRIGVLTDAANSFSKGLSRIQPTVVSGGGVTFG